MLIRSANLAQPSFVYPTDYGQGSRGLWSGGGNTHWPSNQYTNNTHYITISTPGNSSLFGSVTSSLIRCTGTSGRGRGIISGGRTHTTPVNTISYVNIATPGNPIDFGTLTATRQGAASTSNGTRGLILSGSIPLPYADNVSSVDYITIATGGNAGNFGNYAESRTGNFSGDSALSDGFYCVTQGRKSGQSYYDYWSINTLSDSTKWGDQRTGGVKDAEYVSAVSNGTRGVWCGGYDGSWSKKMDYLSFATQSNALQFGEMLQYKYQGGGVSDGQRGVVGGDGYRDPTPILEYFNISTAAGSAVVSATFGLCLAPNNYRMQAAVYAGD